MRLIEPKKAVLQCCMKKNKLRTKKSKIPRIIQITPEQQVEFTAAVMESNLAENFRDALIGMINGNRWLVDGVTFHVE